MRFGLWHGYHKIPQESSKVVSLGAPVFLKRIPGVSRRVTERLNHPSQRITKIDRRAISEIVPDSYGFPAIANTAFDL